MDQIQ